MPRKVSRKTSKSKASKRSRSRSKPTKPKPTKPKSTKRSRSRSKRSKKQKGGDGETCRDIFKTSHPGKWIVFGFKTCGFYSKATNLLDQRKQPYVNYEFDREEFDCFEKIGKDDRTSPVIYDPYGEFIGGFSQLQKVISDEKYQKFKI